MATKAVLVFCAQALLVQYISAQCLGAAPWAAPYPGQWGAAPYAEVPLAAPCAFAPINGGGFQITSMSPMSVTGVSVTSENAYEGPLSVCGAVPFLGAVALEGALPTAGSGAITYGCGNGNVAMTSESINAGPYGYAPELYAYPPEGYYGRPCGCGMY
ncbi:chorion class B protein Ld34-like [Bicyclus anynana]|uniref:Chorion class B protein Ld34-like n=1 Tax=Bicyclus anynana TaxID=110368 RepID=A0ABM3LV68_BICAN|nr:chorion class B protein Ld34-like [Bicyclus anynana]